jgi:mono/diheme cytochrome c family protein
VKKALMYGFAVLAFGYAVPAYAQETPAPATKTYEVDKDKAKSGAKVFNTKGCMGCHTIGKGRLAGPDLAGLLDRRDAGWVHKWLKDPAPMFESDSVVIAMVKEFKGAKMPNMKLTDDQIEQLIHYMVDQGQKAKK